MGASTFAFLRTGTAAAAQASSLSKSAPGSNDLIFGRTEQGLAVGATAASGIVASAGGVAAASASGGVASFAAAAGPYAAIAIPVLILLSKIFHGADPLQVPAAQIEQIFEATANNFLLLAKAGMIDKNDAAQAMSVLIQQGNAYYDQNPNLGKAGQKGRTNLAYSINGYKAQALALADNIPAIPVDLNVARGYYVGGKGWYPQSITAAINLTNTFLQSYSRPLSVSGLLASAEKAVGSLTGNNPALFGGSLLLVGVLLFGLIRHLWIIGAVAAAGIGYFYYEQKNSSAPVSH